MISPEARERLASRMDDRRLELGLRWRDVAEAGGISYEALRDVRNGTGGIRRLTEHAIETGLHWEAGSVARILSGGEPVALGPRPVAADPGLLEMTPAMARAIAPHVEEINLRLELARRRYPGRELTGAIIFPTDPQSAATWDDVSSHGWPEPAVIQGVAAMRAWAQEEAEGRGNRAASG